MDQFTVITKCKKCKKAVVLDLNCDEMGSFFYTLYKRTGYQCTNNPDDIKAYYCRDCTEAIEKREKADKEAMVNFMAGGAA